MDAIWVASVKGKILKKSEAQRGGNNCSLWTGYSQRNYGVMNIVMPGSNSRTRMRAHRLAYIVYSGILHLPRGHDVSHLCHNSLCVNFDHLSLEPHNINVGRCRCKRHHLCLGHGPYRACLL